MPIPKTRDDLIQTGYIFSNHGRCRSCHEEIEWWTTPNARKAPYDLMPDGNSQVVSHFATCTTADQHRGIR